MPFSLIDKSDLIFIVGCGSRSWKNRSAIKKWLKSLDPKTVIMVGGAPGADTIIEEEGKDIGLRVLRLRALWELDRFNAGFDRNSEMLLFFPRQVRAFWDGKSNGTKDTIDKAKKIGIPVKVTKSSG